MNLKDVLDCISLGEGQCIEFKESFSEENQAIESLCAFSHSEGGTVLFGVSDDGRVKGVTLGNETLERFANKIQTNSSPPLVVSIYNFFISGKQIVCASVERACDGEVCFVFGKPLLRVGKTNQLMSPNEIKNRIFLGFKAENLVGSSNLKQIIGTESWEQREKRRRDIYIKNDGLFLVHTWRPSNVSGQVADIVIHLTQHREGPLTIGSIKCVEYHLGPQFFKQTVVKTDPSDDFRLEVSAYAPMLCLARVHFDDGKPSLDLQRYIDFWPSSREDYWAQEKMEHSIQSLLWLLNDLDGNSDLDYVLPTGETVREVIESHISGALYNLTKVLSRVYDATNSWTPSDSSFLMNERVSGLKELIKMYCEREDRYKQYLGNGGFAET